MDRLLFLPPWIREQAAATEYVQKLLGDEVSRITPMFVLLFEFYVKCALIIVYRIVIHEELDDDAIAASTNNIRTAWEIFALYGGGAFLSSLHQLPLLRNHHHRPSPNQNHQRQYQLWIRLLTLL